MTMRSLPLKSVANHAFYYDADCDSALHDLHQQHIGFWRGAALTATSLRAIYRERELHHIFHSNRIEGNALSYAETVKVVRDGEVIPDKSQKDQLEAKNLANALDYAFATADDSQRAITQSTLRQIHALILVGIEEDAGAYRQTRNRISGSPHETPDPFVVSQAMTALSDTIQHAAETASEATKSPIPACAAVHALLLQIHPFSDGNGRSSRVLLNAMLMRRGYLPCVITEDRRQAYIEALNTAWEGDLTALITLCRDSIAMDPGNRAWL